MLTIEQRLEQLEKSNRRLKWTASAFALAGCAIAAIAAAPDKNVEFDSIITKGITLIDDNRVLLGSFSVTPEGTVLQMLSSKQAYGIKIRTDKNGAGRIDLMNGTVPLGKGEPVSLVSLGASEGGGGVLETYNSKGGLASRIGNNSRDHGLMATFDEQQRPLVVLGEVLEKGGGAVSVFNQNGHEAGVLLGAADHGELITKTDSGELLFQLTAVPAGALVRVNNAKGQTTSSLGSTADGYGAVDVYSAGGQRLKAVGSTTDGHGGIFTYNSKGQEMVRLSASPDGADGRISALHSTGQPLVLLGNVPDGGGAVEIFRKTGGQAALLGAVPEGNGELVTRGSKDQTLFHVTATAKGAWIKSNNAKGETTCSLGNVTEGHGVLEVFSAAGQRASVIGTTSEGHGGLTTFNNQGQQMVRVSVADDGSEGRISTMNGRGHPVVRLGATDKHYGVVLCYDDEGQNLAAIGGSDDGRGAFSAYDKKGRLQVDVGATTAGGEIKILNSAGVDALKLSVDKSKGGVLTRYNSDGEPLK